MERNMVEIFIQFLFRHDSGNYEIMISEDGIRIAKFNIEERCFDEFKLIRYHDLYKCLHEEEAKED